MTNGQQNDRGKTAVNWAKSLFWALVMFAFAWYTIHRTRVSIGTWIWFGVLVVAGVANLLIAVLSIVGKEWVDPKASAKRLAAQQRTLFGIGQVYRQAEHGDIQKLDQRFYTRKTEELQSLGFRHMREVVNVTVSNAWPRNLAVIRGFLDPSGTVYASVYHLRLFGFFGFLQFIGLVSNKLKIVECETELSDGTFVATTNASSATKMLTPPFMHRTPFPFNTPTEAIVHTHLQTLASILAQRPGVSATVCGDNSDVQALQDRMQAMRAAWRSSPDFDYQTEWQRISGRPMNDATRETLNHFQAEMAVNPPSAQPPRNDG